MLLKLNSKDQSFKINYCLNYLQLIDLFFKIRHVFKNKSIKFDKWSLNTGITKHFLIWQTSSPSQAKFRVHSLVVQLYMAPLEITNFISTTCVFLGGKSNFITSKCHYLVNWSFQFTFWILIPWLFFHA